MAVFEYKEKIGILDIRKENLLSNKGVIRILEDVACEASQDVGYGINNMNETDLTWILLYWKIEILKREKYNELLTIKTWTRESSKMFTFRDFEVYNSSNELLIKASTKWAAISPSQGNPNGELGVQNYLLALQPFLVQMSGYELMVEKDKTTGAATTTTTINYEILDVTKVPAMHQSNFRFNVEYNKDVEQTKLETDLKSKGYICK